MSASLRPAADAAQQGRTALREALRLAAAGYALTPVTITRLPSGKKSARFHNVGERGADGKRAGWRHESAWSCDPDMIKAWWTDYPDTSFALGGAANGLEGVDLDVKPREGIDGVTAWQQHGMPTGGLVQFTPSGGVHMIWRCRDDGTGLPQEAGKTFGRGIDTRNRSGLFFAAGAYVLGEPGHYEVVGELVPRDQLTQTPTDVVALFADAAARERQERPADGRILLHDRDWQSAKAGEALEAIRTHDRDASGYRAKLQHAGLFLGRAVEQGFITAQDAEAQIVDAHRSVWGPAVWPENLKDIRDALRDGPALERWREPTPSAAAGSDSASAAADPEADAVRADARELALQKLIDQQDLVDEAKRIRAARDRPPLAVLDWDAFLDAEQPDYLVPRMLYRDSTAKVYGAPGSTKSFFLLDLALHLATGTPWRGLELPRTRVDYVAAEGQAVNVGRAVTWLHAHEVDRAAGRGWFNVIPQGVLLTPEGIAGYLEQVRAQRPGLIILDTKNAMMDGEENSASDVAVMVRAMRELRDAAGGACVVLVDHTGMGDVTRGRGSNAVTAAMDTEVRVVLEESGLATAEVTRDKAAKPGALWEYRVRGVEGVPGLRPDGRGAVVSHAGRGLLTPNLRTSSRWWDLDQEQLPAELAVCTWKGHEAAKDAFRVIRFVDDEDGMTRAQIVAALREGPRKHGSSTIGTGLARLAEHGFVDKPTVGRYALGQAYQNKG